MGVSGSLPSPYSRGSAELLALGFHPLPIRPEAKAPGEYRGGSWRGMKEWQRFRDRTPTEFETKLWSNSYPDANIGIVLGSPANGHHVIAIDIDVKDADAFDELIRQIPASPMRKRGAKGETRFYLADKSFKSQPYSLPDKRRLVDVLTGFDARQTVCPPSIHPDTHAPYIWLAGPVAAADLPVFTPEDRDRLEEALEALGWSPDGNHSGNPSGHHEVTSDPDDFFSETKGAALANLAAWVPFLDLHGLRRARGGYEAVATWRLSSTGRTLEERKRNLSIQRNGITDFGTAQGYSAIDLVMAAKGVAQAEATTWLRERLGLDDQAVTIAIEPKRLSLVVPSKFTELPVELTRVPGLVGLITDWIATTSRRPQRGLSLGAALTVVGTAAGRKYAGPTRSATHLYVLALARTGAGKDHALDQITRLLETSGMGHLVGASQFTSWQAVFGLLSRKPLSLCPMDEIDAFLQRINHARPGSHDGQVSAILRTAWGASFKTMAAPEWAGKESEAVHSPSLSIYGAATPQGFYKSLTGEDVFNGLLNRFLLFSTSAKPPASEPNIDPHMVPPRVTEGLEAIFGSGSALVKATSHNGRSDGPLITAAWADSTAREVYEAFEAKCDALEEENPLVGRTAEMAVRLATIRAIGVDYAEPRVSVEGMEWARDLAWWSYERMSAETADYLADSINQANAQRVLRVIKGKGRVAHADLVRAMQHYLKGRELKELITDLADAGQIVVEDAPRAAGKTGPGPKLYSVA